MLTYLYSLNQFELVLNANNELFKEKYGIKKQLLQYENFFV